MSIAKIQRRTTTLEHHENSASGNQTHQVASGGAGTAAGSTKCKANNSGPAVQQQQQQENNKTMTPTNTAIPTTTTTTTNTTTTTTTTTTKTKNAANAPIFQSQPQQQQQQHSFLPQASLLKIEPFVPTFNSLLRRPIHRSYSTLSNSTSSYIKRTTAAALAAAASSGVGNLLNGSHHPLPHHHHHHPQQFDPKYGLTVGSAAMDSVLPLRSSTTRNSHATHLRRHTGGRGAVTRQRSKSTSSSASNLPSTKTNGTTSANQLLNGGNTSKNASASTPSSATVTQQPNGICRIARLPQEQEKLPDRINYDRRGLTAIPIFEQEPNLRLLSLQHNLINVFHIPKEEPPSLTLPSTVSLNGVGEAAIEKKEDELNRSTPLMNGRASKLPHSSRIGLPAASPNSTSATPSPPPPPPPPFITQPIPLGTNSYSSVNNKSAMRSSYLQKSLLYSAQQQQLHHQQQQQQQQQPQTSYLQQLPQPQTQPQLHCRFALKKSKSFVTNYTRHLSTMRRNLQKSQLTRCGAMDTPPQMLNALAGSANLKSFDSGGSSITNITTDSNSSTHMYTCDLGDEEDTMLQQLNIKNKQLVTSYGMIFQNLVFLDLYDNQIERIANIDGLPTLSVLLLGKNRITDISGLASLKSTLRVLDLHGNKITSISNKINCLQELKSLNLAGNQIRQINQNDFNGLLNLKELNLKRNKIKRIGGFQHLTALERLWLCHNDLHKVEDMSSIAKAINLLEVTIENNPVSLAGDCVSFLVSYLPNLQSLSQMPITDQVRRAAMAWRKNKELSDANYSHLSTDHFNSIRREEVISNARTNWELLRSQQTMQQVTQRQKRSPIQRELAKINESNEAVAGFEELQEFIKLPPIQQQLQQQEPAIELDEPHTNSSNSSLGPNLDSSSSCFSSDNEESSPKMCKSTAHAKKRYGKRPESAAQAGGKKQQQLMKEINQGDMNNQQPSLITITTTEPDCQQNTVAAQQQNGQHLTLATPAKDSQHNQIVNEANEPGNVDTNASVSAQGNESSTTSTLHGISNASITMLSPQIDKQGSSSSKQLRTITSAQPRVATPTTPITASSTTLSLGFNNNSNGHGNSNAYNNGTMASIPTHSGVGMGTGSTSQSNIAAANPKRYMQGSLMRSHTIVGSGGAGSGGKSRASVANQSQYQHQQNISINNGGTTSVVDQKNSGSIALSCIVAPAAGTAASTAATTTTSTKSNAGAVAGNQANSGVASSSKQVIEREREQGGDYLIEICGRYLNIYGQGALRFIDKQWSPTKANDVHTLNFSYINFNNIVAILARIKVRFPHAENFVFRETNISCLGQLNALAELQGIASLFIDPEGNAITTKDLWRLYAIYRLSHWGLKLLNGQEVSESEINEANVMYAGLSDLVLWSMPEAMLQPLLARLRLDETCTASKLTPKEWLMKADKSLRIVVGKEALQWKKSIAIASNSHAAALTMDTVGGGGAAGANGGGVPSSQALSTAAGTARERGKMHFALMMENTCNAVEKLHKLETLWPSLLLDIVRNTLLDYSQLDVYVRNLMSEIMK